MGFRDKMAQMIAESGDSLWLLEHDVQKDVRMWYIKDHECLREPQYQVWKGEKRRYVGTNRSEAYNDYERAKRGE